MKLLAVAIALSAVAATVRASDDPTTKLAGVHDLTPADFDSVVSGRQAALIEFYAPWCGHCKRLVPEYQRLGEAIANNPKLAGRVVIAKVNADEHRSLGERFGVRGFPTLKWFPRGSPKAPEDYAGGRTVDAFLQFINDKLKSDAGFARVFNLSPLARKFTQVDDREAVIEQAESVVPGLPEQDAASAALYIRYMKKALEKGNAYLETELKRLEGLLEKGASAKKIEEISKKVSVLSDFAEKDEAAAAATAAATDDDDEDEDEDEDHEEEAPLAADQEVDLEEFEHEGGEEQEMEFEMVSEDEVEPIEGEEGEEHPLEEPEEGDEEVDEE